MPDRVSTRRAAPAILVVVATTIVVLSLVGCPSPIDSGWNPSNSDTTPPREVLSLRATAGDGQLTVRWTNPSDSDLDHIVIHYGTDGNPETEFSGVIDPSGTVIDSLQNGVEYTIRVCTADAHGNVSTGRTVSASPVAPDTTPPDPVTNLSASVATSYVLLTWTEPADAATCEVWYAVSGQTQTLKEKNPIGSGLYSLDTSLSYDFTVYAVDAAGNKSSGQSITTTPYGSGGGGTPGGSIDPGESVTTTITSDFDGFAYGNLYNAMYLDTWWIQTEFYTWYYYAFYPSATLTNTNGIIELSVSGIATAVTVEELTDADEATITSSFDGFDNGNTWTLDDGRTVTQTDYTYSYHYAYRPSVVLYTRYGSKYMYVIDMGESVRVTW